MNFKTKWLKRVRDGIAVLVAGASCLGQAHAAVWESRAEWTPEAEARYSEWVRAHWTVDIFTNPSSLLFNLPTDCADAAYTMRATFSYLNQLPFAMKDPSGGSRPISNEMTRWDRQALTDQQKFIEFVKYVHNLGSSTTIADDTFPVLINRSWVRAGDILLRYKHHVYEIKDVISTGRLRLISSTVPRTVRRLIENLHFTASDQFMNENSGIRAFREPRDLFTPAWKIAGYSNEQFKFPRDEYPEIVKARLALVNETPDEELRILYDRLCRKANDRVNAVNEAIAYQAKIGGRCMKASEFDDYSTTGRDQDLRTEFETLKSRLSSHMNQPGAYRNVALWKEAMKAVYQNNPDNAAQMTKSFAFCQVVYKSGAAMDLKELRRRFELGLISDDPNLDLEARWGAQTSVPARSCHRY